MDEERGKCLAHQRTVGRPGAEERRGSRYLAETALANGADALPGAASIPCAVPTQGPTAS